MTLKSHRVRDAKASRQALFESARDLFGQKGFDRTTIREIGERAGVDAALIARYFGSKVNLYVEIVAAEQPEASLVSDRDDDETLSSVRSIAETLLRHFDETGPGPLIQALIRFDTPKGIRKDASAYLTKRIVDPLTTSDSPGLGGDARLRAEVAASALIGVALARRLRWFEEVQHVDRDDLVALISQIIRTEPRPDL